MIGRSLREIRSRTFSAAALASVVLLVCVGLAIALFSERAFRARAAEQAGAQTELLASAVSGALAFNDAAAAQDYVDAAQVNPQVLSAAVYDQDRRLVAAFGRGTRRPGDRLASETHATRLENGELIVTRPVTEAGQRLGAAQIRLTAEPLSQQLARYTGLGLLLIMALVAIGVLAVTQSALGRANIELRARAGDLSDANARLQREMAERAKAEEALLQSQKMEAIGRLTGGVAHDFNNLLMVISSGVDLMDRTEDSARRERLKAGVKQAVERGADLTRHLLAFSRTSAVKSAVVDLAAKVEGMRVILERSLREDIEVRLEMVEALWPVEVDVSELELALLNIAVNARDAMPDGGVLTIGARNQSADGPLGDHVVLWVSDTGTGMSEETLANAFEPFFTTKGVGKGTGLGLSQVYGFARSSGGAANVKSRLGEGSTIFLCLPRSGKSPAADPAAAAVAVQRGRGRVLLVEDDDGVAAMVGEMLTELGYTWDRASSAQEALGKLETDRDFILVFSDMVMPGAMDGRLLAREIRARHPGLPILLTSGYSAAAAEAAAEGVQVLAKPYRIAALGEAIAATAAAA